MNDNAHKKRKTFKVLKEELGCSQPYLNRGKCEARGNGVNKEFPLPVIEINKKYYLTDGHTRAFFLASNEVEVYLDEDIIESKDDFAAYSVFVRWTLAAGVFNVYDLANRIIEEKQFKDKWIKRCERHYQSLKSKD